MSLCFFVLSIRCPPRSTRTDPLFPYTSVFRSVGAMPTARFAGNLDGVTGVRGGVFVFFDLFMAGLGVCRQDDIALSVLTTVIGHQPEKDWILVDAGWMAMSRDRGTAGQPVDQYYGVVCDVQGRPLADLVLKQTHQDQGIIIDRKSVVSGKRVSVRVSFGGRRIIKKQ